MTIRFQPDLSIRGILRSSLELYTRSTMRTDELVDAVTYVKQLLGPALVEMIEADPPCLLAQTLREAFDLKDRAVDPNEACALLITLCAGMADEDAEHADRPLTPRSVVPLERLASLGDEGVEVALGLSNARLRAAGLEVDPEQKQEILAALSRPPCAQYYEYQRRALEPASAVPKFKAPDLSQDSARLVESVQRIERLPSELQNVRFDSLIENLTYGSRDLFELLDRELRAKPPSALAKSLNAHRGGFKGPPESAATAKLLHLLWNLRDPAHPESLPLQRFVDLYGEPARAIADQILQASRRTRPERPDYASMAEIVDALAMMMTPEKALPLVDQLVRKDNLIPRKLPALEIAKQEVDPYTFRGRGLIAIQHVFPSLIPTLEAYIEKGMRPHDIHVLGTPYASNPLVCAYGRLKGLNIVGAADVSGSTRNFEEHRLNQVVTFLIGVCGSARIPPGGWTLLDDGGMLNAFANGLKEDKLGLARIVGPRLKTLFDCPLQGVEQTTRGLTELAGDLQYAVVALPGTDGKILEGRLIGWALARSLCFELRHHDAIDRVRNLSLISAGTVGIEAAEFLRGLRLHVELVDKNEGKRKAAIARQFKTHESIHQELLDRTDFLLSCTGMRIDLSGYRGMAGSGSSAAVEFDTDRLEGAEPFNWGRPMNFIGDGHEPLSPKQIGCTQASLFLAAAQKVPPGTKGVVALADQPQGRVVDYWKANGGLEVAPLSLEEPTLLARPDTLNRDGHASHREWMTYFRNFNGAISPPPTSSRFMPMIYCFRERGQPMRIVDTRVGRSYELDAPMPKTLLPGRLMFEGDFGMLERRDQGFLLRRASLGANGPTTGDARWVGSMAAAHFDPRDGSLSYAFDRGIDLSIVRKGDFEHVQRVPRGSEAESSFLWTEGGSLLQIEKRPPKVHRLFSLDAEEQAPSIPSDIVEVLSISESLSMERGSSDPILVGRTADGRTAVLALGSSNPPEYLPSGAVFRSVAREDPDDPRRIYRVYYSKQGDVDEIDRHESFPLSFDHP
jgi:hypothetical protein